LEAVGSARAVNSAVLSAKVTESVVNVPMMEGSNVKAGEVLIELEHAEEQAEIAREKANLVRQDRDFKRVSKLVGDAASRARYDEIKALYEEAQARVAAAEARLNDRIIKAPFDGVVGLRQISPGSLVRPGDVMTTIADIAELEVDFALPEAAL